MNQGKQLIDRIREIFSDARNIADATKRDEYLTRACGKGGNLRQEIESLLAVHTATGGFLTHDASGASLLDSPDMVGLTIGHYHLEELLGEGGFGEVYRAEQTEPLHRMVALKIIKLGMDTKEVLARFEAERQALARMDHPNIAQVYDAGVTEIGRPYFVMELVSGIPLLDYCDRHRLPLPERIQLFRQVCDGVQHAHQKGILHRDLKPGNILISEENNKLLPKVIDFGVAKSLEGRLTDQTLVTMQERVLGTPMYMSPEQLGCDGTGIDTRTDIYSLGIILYELVTGATPFQKELPADISDMRRIMETIELPRPSRLYHALGDASSAHARDLKPQALEKLLRGDLDWVVMKAIDRERDRRYADVGALSTDLLRYLENMPVSAGPPGLIYRSRKFIRRHRTGLVATTFIVVILLVGAWISTVALLHAIRESERARRQESRAVSASERAHQALEQANKNKSLAEASQQYATSQSARALREEERAVLEAGHARKQKALAEATFGFLADELLLHGDSVKEANRDIKLRTVVDQAAERLEHHFSGLPLEKGRIHQVLGNLYMRLTEYNKARRHVDQAVQIMQAELEPEDLMMLACLHDQAEIMCRQGQYEEAEEQFRRVLEVRERLLGADHPDTLLTLRGLAVCRYGREYHREAEETFRSILEMQTAALDADDPQLLQTQYNLALALGGRGAHADAEVIHRRVLESRQRILGSDHPATLKSMQGLCEALRAQDKVAGAWELHRAILTIQMRVLSPDHPETLNSMYELARSLFIHGRNSESERLLRQFLKIQQENLGVEHPETLKLMGELTDVLVIQGKYPEAESICRERFSATQRSRSPEDPQWLDAQHTLAHVLFKQEKFSEAEKLVRSELAIRKQVQDLEHPDILKGMNLLADIMNGQGLYTHAEQYYRMVVQLNEQIHGSEHHDVLAARYQLAVALMNAGSYSKAEELLRQTLAKQQRTLGEENPETLQTMGALATAARYMGRDAEADEMDLRILELYQQ